MHRTSCSTSGTSDDCKLAAESSIREIVGQTPLEEVLATKRTEVEAKTRDVLQRIMDDYKAGVFIADVKMQKVDPPQKVDAFNDVQRARQDMSATERSRSIPKRHCAEGKG